MTALYTIDDVRAAARYRAPYYWSAIDRLTMREDRSVPTMTTSARWVTHYNPECFERWTLDESAAVLIHELNHLLRDHHGRCGDRSRDRFNVAADAEINQRLPGLPEGAVYPSTFGAADGLTAETYYAMLPESGEDQSGDQSGEPGGDQPGQSGADCGSAAGGDLRPNETGDPVPNAGEIAETIRETASEVLNAGDGPGDDEREWAETILHIDRSRWYAALAHAAGRTLAPTSALRRGRWPGRREQRDMGGAMVPRWTGERPSCAVIIDTSSSIQPSDLDMAMAAGQFVGRLADVTYWGCDTYPVKYGARLPERIHGGGGTDLRNGIAAAIADGARAVVVITDTITRWPEVQTSVPLIVGGNVKAQPTRDTMVSMWRVPDWATYLPIRSAEE